MPEKSVEELPPEARVAVKRVREAFDAGKDRHEHFRKRSDRYYALYRSYRELKRTYADTKPRDVDTVLRDAQHGFGADLFIPYVFSVIETTVPRLLAQNPKMDLRPAHPDSDATVQNMELLIDRQQQKIDYYLRLQDVAKVGLMLGLGVQKTFWEERLRGGTKVLERATAREADGPEWVVGNREVQVTYSGPMAEAVDPYDFITDPAAHDMQTMGWSIHRLWKTKQQVRRLVESRKWTLPAGVTIDDLLESGAPEGGRSDVWSARDAAAGYPTAADDKAKRLEVWEFWSDDDFITVVNRWCPVQIAPENPFWHGELPFQIYRPTRVPFELVGIGEAEAIEDLQEEMNALRSQRRDNATLVLQRPMAYFDGMVDTSDVVFGPGAMFPVDGDPRELLFPIPLQDIPASGYQEEANLQRDIERITGIDDTVSGGEGGGGASATATGVQMVQAAANVRIANKTKRLATEIVKPACGQFIALNQQKIVSTVFVPGPPQPGDGDKRWSWYAMGPAELAGEFECEPDSSTMSPENPVEKVDKGTRLLNAFQEDPLVRPEKVREYVLEMFGVPAPQTWLVPQEPQIPAHVIDQVTVQLAKELGIAPENMHEAVSTLIEEAMAAEAEQQEPGAGGAPQPPQGQPQGPPE